MLIKKNLRLLACLALTFLLASCQWAYKRQLDKQYGPEQEVNRELTLSQQAKQPQKNEEVNKPEKQQPATKKRESASDSKNSKAKANANNANNKPVTKPENGGEAKPQPPKASTSTQNNKAGNNKQEKTQPAKSSNRPANEAAKDLDALLIKTNGSEAVEKNSSNAKPKPALHEQAQTVLDQRCVVCHACYDAPCQLKLGSAEGLNRGASPAKVYYGERIMAAEPTRLFIDATSAAQWREKGFHPVLNERHQSPETNLQLSVLYQLLKQKKEQPLPNQKLLDEEAFTLDLNRDQICPKIEGLKDYQEDHPLWGMPYGLPAISEQEFSVVRRWVANGSKFSAKPLSADVKKYVQHWEAFFNGKTLKKQLVSRYLFEHLYLANLYFPESDSPKQFFKLVRSRTAPGEPIDIIATRRVYDDPKGAVYYRLQPVTETIVNKTHQPYRLDSQRENFWNEIFYEADYQVTKRVGYNPEESSNPFLTFKQLPVKSRYKFLLEEAEYSIMNFIKGPVCRGQIALDVIQDHFWVTFISPEVTNESTMAYLEEHADLLRFPARWESNGGLLAWYDLAKRQKQYLKVRAAFYNQHLGPQVNVDESLIWDGNNGQNPNAALTIFRHFNSATVVKGFAGANPKTTWVINYPLLERIHYLLVAGFDVYGNLMHQLHTRLYMDFLRMEGEANFIALLPKEQRHPAFEQWYVNAEDKVSEYFDLMLETLEMDTDIPFPKDNSVRQNIEQLQGLLAKHSHAKTWQLEGYPKLIKRSAAKIDAMQGEALHLLPQMAFIRVQDGKQHYWLTLVHHNAHKNMTRVFTEKDAWWPERDTASLLPGLVGAYPNVFFDMNISELATFVDDIGNLADEKSYEALVDTYGVRRTDANFWVISDALHQAYKKQAGIGYGLMDFNRYENR